MGLAGTQRRSWWHKKDVWTKQHANTMFHIISYIHCNTSCCRKWGRRMEQIGIGKKQSIELMLTNKPEICQLLTNGWNVGLEDVHFIFISNNNYEWERCVFIIPSDFSAASVTNQSVKWSHQSSSEWKFHMLPLKFQTSYYSHLYHEHFPWPGVTTSWSFLWLPGNLSGSTSLQGSDLTKKQSAT